ncbi:MAG: RES family NAD+ phosphorylase [Sphingopyxis terrae]|nr:MAG: RES family NAD+ phosphorylase [Sphingopyxis terrae]
MTLDLKTIGRFTRKLRPRSYLRVTELAHRATPLGMGFGKTRFASPADAFKLLYIGEDLATAAAETIIRDRFEGTSVREISEGEITKWGATEVDATKPLRLLDLRGDACFQLNVSTDIVGAKGQDEARAFSQSVYDETDLDGILYHSRLRKRKNCIAVYDRAVTGLCASDVDDLVTLPRLVPALRTLRVSVIT